MSVNINTADEKELQKIVHIGPVRARKIITQRGLDVFRDSRDLHIIKGLSDARIADIVEQGEVRT